jgi:hypothetical protein
MKTISGRLNLSGTDRSALPEMGDEGREMRVIIEVTSGIGCINGFTFS